MSDRVKLRAVDPEVADGTYDVTVTGGVASLTAATSGGGTGVVETIVPGTGIAVDSTDPANPVVSATGGGGSVAVEDEGAEVVAAASRLNFTGAGVTVSDSGSGEVEVAIPGGGAGGGGFWTADVNLPGTTLTGWTAASGTWSTDGTVIKQTTVGTPAKRLILDGARATAAYIAEAEIRLDTAPGAGANLQAGLIIGSPGANGTGGVVVQFQNSNNSGTTWPTLTVEQDGLAVTIQNAIPSPPTRTNFNKLRAVLFGDGMDIYLNGAFLFTHRNFGRSLTPGLQVGLVNYNCAVSYRNIKTWSGPALP